MTSDAFRSNGSPDPADGPDSTTAGFFFVHVMKTAGTTFAMQLTLQFSPDSIYPARGIDWESPSDLQRYTDIPRLLAISAERRSQIRIYTGHFPYMVRELLDPRLVVLTLLRDPIERIISVLKHFKRLDDRYRDMDLEQIYDDEHIFGAFVHNQLTAIFSRTPEDGYLTIEEPITVDDHRLAVAKANLAKVQVVGLTSCYADFIAELRTRFGWWPNGLDLSGHANVSVEPWEIRPSLRGRIADDNRHDIDFYRYAERLVRERNRARFAELDGGMGDDRLSRGR
jgi:hypothetical protein